MMSLTFKVLGGGGGGRAGGEKINPDDIQLLGVLVLKYIVSSVAVKELEKYFFNKVIEALHSGLDFSWRSSV